MNQPRSLDQPPRPWFPSGLGDGGWPADLLPDDTLYDRPPFSDLGIRVSRFHSSTATPQDDAQLMRSVAGGDAAAFRQIADKHLGSIVRYAFRLLDSKEEAEEVAQETFLRAWEHAGSYQPTAKLTTWLHTIAHNAAIDRIRKRRETVSDDFDDQPASARPSLLLASKETALAVQSALDSLAPRQRAAISLVHYQGLSGTETAQVLGIEVEAVESLLARGRRKLRKLLGNYARGQRQLQQDSGSSS
jgi:RNA polymerase sigma-70 factor (ECF subfamily)